MAKKTAKGPPLPGLLGHSVALLLVGSSVGFLLRFAYYAVVTWTLRGALQVVAAAVAVTGFGWLGYQLTHRVGWWYAAGLIGGVTAVVVALLAFG